MRSAAARPPSEPFDRHMTADCVRLVILALLVYLMLVTAKVVYLRVRAHAHRSAPESPWGLASYVCFAAIPWVQGLARFGQPLNATRTTLTVAALVTGVIAAYQQVTIQGWNWPPQRWFHLRRRRGSSDRR